MNKLRKIVGVLLALALAALALPASATFNNDYYKLVMSAGPVSPGSQTITATITNKARYDYLRSFTIDAPSGVTITAVASASSSIPASKISLSGNKITVAGIQIPYNGSGALSITATFPATCGIDQPLAWTSTAKGGLFVNWEVFTLTSDSSLVTRLTNLGNLALAFVAPPTSVLKDAPFDVVVKQTSTTCPTTPLPPVAIALASNPAFTTPGTATQNGVQTTFTGNKLGAIGPATLTASAPGYASAAASLTVFTNTAVENSCSSNPSTAPPLTGTFNASCATNNITVTGFAEGFRGFNKDGTSCPAVNFNLTNNICQTVAQTRCERQADSAECRQLCLGSVFGSSGVHLHGHLETRVRRPLDRTAGQRPDEVVYGEHRDPLRHDRPTQGLHRYGSRHWVDTERPARVHRRRNLGNRSASGMQQHRAGPGQFTGVHPGNDDDHRCG